MEASKPDRRTSKLTVWLTAAEKTGLEASARESGLTVAEYVRLMLKITRLPSPLVEGTREGD
jgi:hypothetical protein